MFSTWRKIPRWFVAEKRIPYDLSHLMSLPLLNIIGSVHIASRESGLLGYTTSYNFIPDNAILMNKQCYI